MTNTLRHRGPDDDGLYYGQVSSEGGIALGHRRLSIIDLTTGRQPIANEDQSIWVILNGEIYNYRELKRDAQSRGHRFRTNSDTEVLVHLYEDYGPDFLTKLNGMFALALWDDRRRQLLLARDRMGQKPLAYCANQYRLSFASQIRSLQTIETPNGIDPTAANLYFRFGYIPHPRTIYENFKKLPPAHYLVADESMNVRVVRYWTPRPAPVPSREEEQTKQLRELMTKSVKRRLISDVPVGAFLSGGIDSTVVVGLARECTTADLQTFTIGFDDKEFDESEMASEIAVHLGVPHCVERIGSREIATLPEVLCSFDEPFGDSSALPTYLVSRLTRRTLKVALSGDGGDELFLGYSAYKNLRILELLDGLPNSLWNSGLDATWGRLAGCFPRASTRSRLRALPPRMRASTSARYLHENRIFSPAEAARLMAGGPEAIAENGIPDHLSSVFENSRDLDQVTRASLADIAGYLPCDILTKVDIMSMAHGLECRSPFLDHEVVEFALGLPRGTKLRRFEGKRIVRQTFESYFPKSVLASRKRGFTLPLARWLRNELKLFVGDTLLSGHLHSSDFIDADYARQLANEHLNGVADHARKVWLLLAFELWSRNQSHSTLRLSATQ